MHFKEYSATGKDLIEFGVIFVLIWMFIYIGLVLSPYSGKLWPTLPFLAFGVLCVLLGFALKKKPRKVSEKYIGGIEELGLVVLFFESLPALILLFAVLAKLPNVFGFKSLIALLVPLGLSFFTFIIYWKKAQGSNYKLIKYTKWILFLAILSHLMWVNLLTVV